MDHGAIVGRLQALEALGQLAGRAAAGNGAIAVLVGEAGIGKTRLVAEMSARCGRQGFAVLSGAAGEMEQQRPFGLIVDALRVAWASSGRPAEIGRLLGQAAATSGAVELQVPELVLDELDDLTTDTPVALLLEDLHWADPLSLMCLHRVARAGRRQPLMLVCTRRPWPERTEARALFGALDQLGARTIELGPLTPDEVARLATDLLGRRPGARLLERLQGAGGNPFYVEELLSAYSRAEDGPAAATLGSSRQLSVLHRLGAFGDATQEALRAASVLGTRFSVAELQLALAWPVARIVGALRPALDAGVVTAEDDQLAFRHDLVREALYQDLPAALRQAWHREVAGRLVETGAAPDRVAAHVLAGAEPGDAEAVGWLRQAAARTGERSPLVASQLLQAGLDLCPSGSPLRIEVLTELVGRLGWAGRPRDLAAVCRTALGETRDPERRALFQLGLANALMSSGRLEQACAAFEEAAALSMRYDEAARAMLAAHSAYACALLAAPGAGERLRSLLCARLPPPAGWVVEIALAALDLLQARPDLALAHLDALAAAGAPDVLDQAGVRAQALLALGRLDEARGLLHVGARRAAVDGTAAGEAPYHDRLVFVEYAAGEFDVALAEHEASAELAELTGQHWQTGGLGLTAAIAVHRGDLHEAVRVIARAESELAFTGQQPDDPELARARYLLAAARGDTPRAVAAMAYEAWDQSAGHGYRDGLVWLAPEVVRAALAAGDPDRAAEAVRGGEAVAALQPALSWRGAALRARGLLADEPPLLLEAIVALRAGPRPRELALGLEDAAEALARRGRVEEARPLADEALDLFRQFGATTDAARLRSRLRIAGLHTGSHGRRRRARLGWDSLTSAELRVVALVATGRSNPDIAASLYLSRHTVRAHISAALRKLGVTNRAELAAHAARRGL